MKRRFSRVFSTTFGFDSSITSDGLSLRTLVCTLIISWLNIMHYFLTVDSFIASFILYLPLYGIWISRTFRAFRKQMTLRTWHLAGFSMDAAILKGYRTKTNDQSATKLCSLWSVWRNQLARIRTRWLASIGVRCSMQ